MRIMATSLSAVHGDFGDRALLLTDLFFFFFADIAGEGILELIKFFYFLF